MNATAAGWLPTHAQAPGLHAGFSLRVVAYLIDGAILSAAFLIAYLGGLHWLALSAGAYPGEPARWRLLVVWQVLPWLYYALFEASALQATPGKLALGLRVTDEGGRRIGFGRATGRFFGKLVSGLVFGLGYLLAGWTARKQALHDLMAGCCVVRASGLAAWRNAQATPAGGMAEARPAPPGPSPGMPGWAIALVVAGGLVFLLLPIAAIIAAVAIPAYQDRTLRAEVEQGVQVTARARALVGEYIHQRGALPGDNRALGLPRPEAIQARYVTSVRVADGQVVVTYGNHADPVLSGGHVVMSPSGRAALLRWRCSSPDIRDRYLPENCR